jgi:thiol-disulfide isomerase/thioredoxin
MRPLPFALALLAGLGACQKPPAQANGAAASSPTIPAPAHSPVQPHKVDRSHAGAPVPGTAFRGLDGKMRTLAAFRGKPLLLNLWATWCAPCVKEMPSLDRLAAAEAGKLEVVALSHDSGFDKVQAFFAKAHIASLAAYLDPDDAVMRAVKVEVLPTTILFDAKGREVWRVAADRDWRDAETAALIAEAGGVSPATGR